MARQCEVEDCEHPHKARGLCNTHYERLRRTGVVDRSGRYATEGCEVEDCDQEHYSLGYCMPHYRRFKKYGDPELGVPPGAAPDPDTRFTTAHGYVKVVRPEYRRIGPDKRYGTINVENPDYRKGTREKRYVLEHRLVMAEHLGRPLRDDEYVHHKNGVKDDNRIENLELWIRGAQPPGARPEDLVAWAHEILERYGHLYDC